MLVRRWLMQNASMKGLVEIIARALVDQPDEVSVNEVEGETVTVLELRVAQQDLGKVIGKQGRTARAIRTILSAAGMKLRKRFVLEILE
jgi:predicted RNA-binding protein YlqC (UPF0109 family)